MRSTSLVLPCTPRILTSGNPTNSSHMRVGSVSTGALRSEGVKYRQIGRAPALLLGPFKHATPRSFPKSHKRECSAVSGIAWQSEYLLGHDVALHLRGTPTHSE